MSQVIGLHGYAYSGKDSLGGFLGEFGFERLAFADPLKAAVCTLNPYVLSASNGAPARIADLVRALGWDRAKSDREYGAEVRRLLQVFGTEIGRQLIGPDIWVNLLLPKIKPGHRYVVTDVRFANEVTALRDRDPQACLVKIVRPGYGPVNRHESDAGLPDELFDVVLSNDGSLDDLRHKAWNIATGDLRG